MPDPAPPNLSASDLYVGGGGGAGGPGTSNRGMSARTNDAMPRFSGTAAPGERVVLEIDGEPAWYQDADAEGGWDFSSPELADGSHSFEMYTENADGDRSDSWEWDSAVSATPEQRANQRARNEAWKNSGTAERRALQDDLTPTPVSAGSGGTDPKKKVAKPAAGNLEKGNTPGG